MTTWKKRIPKKIFITSSDGSYDSSWSELNSEWVLKSFNDEESRRCLTDPVFDCFSTRFSSGIKLRLVDIYDALSLPVMRADLWRYAMIWANGGLYVDADTICRQAIDAWMPECKFWVCVEDNGSYFCQWAFAAQARHPILERCIHLIIANVLSMTRYRGPHSVHSVCGPVLFTEAIASMHCAIRGDSIRWIIESTPNRDELGVVIGKAEQTKFYPIQHCFHGQSDDGWFHQDKNQLIRGGVTMEMNKYIVSDVEMYATPILAGIAHSIITEDEYVIQPIYNHCPEKVKVVVDVGANCGSFSCLCAKRFPDARILSFDPNPNMQKILKANRDDFYPKIEVMEHGLANQEGTLRFVDTVWRDSGSGGSFCVELVDNRSDIFWEINREKTFPATEVKVRKLSDVLKEQGIEHIDILKLDCEGAEYSIIDDLEATGWLPKVSWIRGEYHAGIGSTNRMIEQLSKTHGMHLTAYGWTLEQGGRLGRFIGHRLNG